MKLEPIDTSTTAGKARVMQLAAEGRKVAYQRITGEWLEIPSPCWDWASLTYAVAVEPSVPVGPCEVWCVVCAEYGSPGYAYEKLKDAEFVARNHRKGTVVRYRRVEE